MGKTQIIDNNALKTLLANQRQDIRIGVVDRELAMQMLGLKERDFYKEINDPESLVVKSKKHGRFIFSSVVREFKRIHGVEYRDAVYSLEPT